MNLIKSFLTFFTIPFGLFFGLKYYLYSVVIISFFGLFVDIYFTSKIIGTKLIEYIQIMIKPFIFSVIMLLMIIFYKQYVDLGTVINLFLEVIIGISIYAVLLNFAAKETMNYFLEFFQSFVKKSIR